MRRLGFIIMFMTYFEIFSSVKIPTEQPITMRTFKHLNKEINNLISNPDTRYDDKEILKSHLKTVLRMKTLFISEPGLQSIFKKIENEVTKMWERIDRIEKETKRLQNSRLKSECLLEIDSERYGKAANKIAFLMLDNDKVDSITSELYNGQEKNLKKIIQFVDHIPNVKLSFRMYKNVYNLIGKHGNFTLDNMLLLWNSTANNVFHQYSADNEIKSECFEFFENNFKEPIIKWINGLLIVAMKSVAENKEKLTGIFDMIAYDIKDFKLLRVIWDNFRHEKNVFYKLGRFLRWSMDMRPVSKALLMNGLYDVFFENLIFTRTLQQLIVVSTTALNAYNNGTEQEKKMFDSFTTLRSVKPFLVRLYKSAIINGYFNNLQEIEAPTRDVFLQSPELYRDIIKTTVDEINGEISLVEIVVIFRQMTQIGEDCIGYDVIYEKIKKDENLTSNNIGVLLALEYFVQTTLDETDFKLVGLPIFVSLKQIQFDILQKQLKQNVSKILLMYLYDGNFFDEEHQEIWKQIYLSRNDGLYLGRVTMEYGKVKFETLIAYIMSLPLLNQRLVALVSLQGMRAYLRNKTEDPYELFLVARSHKIVTENENYTKLDPSFQMTSEAGKLKYPSSIRHAVFSHEVYIKNTNKSEYLENDLGNIFTYKNGMKISKWILEKTNNASEFKIRSSESELYLQPGRKTSEKRNVVSGPTDTHKWRLLLTDGGVFIKSVEFDEYLFSEPKYEDRDKRFVYTRPDLVSAHVWAIQEVFVDPFENMKR